MRITSVVDKVLNVDFVSRLLSYNHDMYVYKMMRRLKLLQRCQFSESVIQQAQNAYAFPFNSLTPCSGMKGSNLADFLAFCISTVLKLQQYKIGHKNNRLRTSVISCDNSKDTATFLTKSSVLLCCSLYKTS